MSSEITIQQQMDRFMQGAGDALTDDTVARLGFMMNELLIIADRVTRNKNIMKLLEMSESKDFAKTLDALSVAFDSYKNNTSSSGGIGGMIYTASRQGRIDKVFAMLFVIIIVGFIQDKLFVVLDKKLFPHKHVGGK